MARITAHVVAGVLTVAAGDDGAPEPAPAGLAVPVGAAAWFAWLAQARAFAYRGPAGHFSARREPRRGGQYWYAYRRRSGVLRTAYLGRDADLTPAGLDRAAGLLAGPPPAAAPRIPRRAAPVAAAGDGPADPARPPPLRPDLLPRPRLIARLTAAVAHPLTLVVAPAGFGKTTLLAAWAAHWPGPVAWVALDARDNDPARLWGRIDATLARLADAGPAAPPGGTGAAPRGVLVLDDFHKITAPGLLARLAALPAELPPALHLLIATRAAPPWPLARLRAADAVAEIGPDALRFTATEADAFVRAALRGEWPAAAVAALAAQGEGWIAGLQLLVLAAREGAASGPAPGPPPPPLSTGDQRYVHAYLAEQVFDRLSASVQHFLLATAILDRLSGPLCAALTGRPGGAAQLAALVAANLFLAPLDATGPWYRYHALFAAFLRARLAHQTPDPRPALHRRAAAWYAGQGWPADAVPHALAAADFATAATLISVSAPALVQRGEVTTILGWLDALPAAVVAERPDLAIWYAWMLLLTGQLAAVEPRLQAAERGLQARAADPGAGPGRAPPAATLTPALGQILVIRASLARARDEAGPTLALAQHAQTLFQQHAGAERAMESLIWLNLGYAHWRQGDPAAAAPALASARQISEAGGQVYTAVGAIFYLAAVAIGQGRLYHAETLYRQALHLATGPDGRVSPAAGVACVGLGALHYEWNDLPRAAQYLAQGRALAERAGAFAPLLTAVIGLARVQQAHGDYAGAMALLAQAEELADRSQAPHDRARVAAAQARIALAQGDPRLAAARLQAALLSAAPDPPAAAGGAEAEYAVLARLLLALGRVAEALTLLDRLHAAAAAAGYTGHRVECLALQALAWQRQAAPARAAATLAEALALAAPAGYVRLFVDEGPPMRRLVHAALAAGAAPHPEQEAVMRAYSTALLRACAVEPAAPGPAGPPAALTARERDVLALLARGLAYQAIAERLIVTENTARWHIKNLYHKLGVRRRAQAIGRAQEHGLLP